MSQVDHIVNSWPIKVWTVDLVHLVVAACLDPVSFNFIFLQLMSLCEHLNLSVKSFFLFFQSAEESELPVTSNIGPEGTERAIVAVDTASPSSSAQFASGNVTPPTSMADNASVTASLRVVYVLS